MRHLLAAAAVTGLLFASGAVFAQSGQGGYTGRAPAPAPATSAPQPAMPGSGQGGYTGQNPGSGAATSGSSGSMGQGSGQGGYLGTNPGGNPAATGQQMPPSGSPQTPPRR